eukprot:INCI4792.1.p1 GENE.INCI4792.1~~INCI4792.1.p1  ORF type:complete len:666 (+),score=128.84 INCI4792.1:468-2465(+)
MEAGSGASEGLEDWMLAAFEGGQGEANEAYDDLGDRDSSSCGCAEGAGEEDVLGVDQRRSTPHAATATATTSQQWRFAQPYRHDEHHAGQGSTDTGSAPAGFIQEGQDGVGVSKVTATNSGGNDEDDWMIGAFGDGILSAASQAEESVDVGSIMQEMLGAAVGRPSVAAGTCIRSDGPDAQDTASAVESVPIGFWSASHGQCLDNRSESFKAPRGEVDRAPAGSHSSNRGFQQPENNESKARKSPQSVYNSRHPKPQQASGRARGQLRRPEKVKKSRQPGRVVVFGEDPAKLRDIEKAHIKAEREAQWASSAAVQPLSAADKAKGETAEKRVNKMRRWRAKLAENGQTRCAGYMCNIAQLELHELLEKRFEPHLMFMDAIVDHRIVLEARDKHSAGRLRTEEEELLAQQTVHVCGVCYDYYSKNSNWLKRTAQPEGIRETAREGGVALESSVHQAIENGFGNAEHRARLVQQQAKLEALLHLNLEDDQVESPPAEVSSMFAGKHIGEKKHNTVEQRGAPKRRRRKSKNGTLSSYEQQVGAALARYTRQNDQGISRAASAPSAIFGNASHAQAHGLCVHTTAVTAKSTAQHLATLASQSRASLRLHAQRQSKEARQVRKQRQKQLDLKTRCSESACTCKRFVASSWMPDRCERCAHVQEKHNGKKS